MPVVCVTGAFTLTPLFAHNQSTVLNQLLSPADALPYNANINVNNVEVRIFCDRWTSSIHLRDTQQPFVVFMFMYAVYLVLSYYSFCMCLKDMMVC